MIRTALAAAAWTAGRCDPTVGTAVIRIGYDRDFAAIRPDDTCLAPDPVPPLGWQAVRLRGNELAIPEGVRLDLGATAKGLGADRAAAAAYATVGEGGVLVSLGGDIAVAGRPPVGGWPVLVADEHRQVSAARNLARPAKRALASHRTAGCPAAAADPAIAQQVRLGRGGLATSSTTCRRWLRAGRAMHHIVDPRTGLPAGGPWRTVSVAATTCSEANAAATAAIVAGAEAVVWLADHGLPARLISHDGQIARTGGWPDSDDEAVAVPAASWLAGWCDRAVR